jgi:hypothetical protein
LVNAAEKEKLSSPTCNRTRIQISAIDGVPDPAGLQRARAGAYHEDALGEGVADAFHGRILALCTGRSGLRTLRGRAPRAHNSTCALTLLLAVV